MVHSLFSAEELLVLIPNIILISIGNTFLVQVCFYLLYIFIELEVELHVFSILVWLPYLTRNFGLCFHLCFDFEMHRERLYCPFQVILQLNHKSRKSAKFHFCKVLSPQRYRNLMISSPLHKINIPKFSRNTTFYFLRYAYRDM